MEVARYKIANFNQSDSVSFSDFGIFRIRYVVGEKTSVLKANGKVNWEENTDGNISWMFLHHTTLGYIWIFAPTYVL